MIKQIVGRANCANAWPLRARGVSEAVRTLQSVLRHGLRVFGICLIFPVLSLEMHFLLTCRGTSQADGVDMHHLCSKLAEAFLK